MEQNQVPPQGTPDFSSILSGILSNPEMMSAISQMADKLKGDGEAPTEQAMPPAPAPTDDSSTAVSKSLGDMAGLLGPLLSATDSTVGNDNRACLLRALKPYLSAGRSEAVDYIIKFSRISEMLKKLS